MATNSIYIFAQNATSGDRIIPDTTWASTNARLDGEQSGIASSQNYNTALRQSSFMARTLAQVFVNRFNADVQCVDGEEILTKSNELAAKFNSGSFLSAKEVIKNNIADKAVDTAQIADNAVTSAQLGNIIALGTAKLNTGVGELTVTLSQDAQKNGLKVGLTGKLSGFNPIFVDNISDISADNFTTYSSGDSIFKYRASIAVSGIKGDTHYPIVNFGEKSRISGIFSSDCESADGVVYIYSISKPAESINISSILAVPIK